MIHLLQPLNSQSISKITVFTFPLLFLSDLTVRCWSWSRRMGPSWVYCLYGIRRWMGCSKEDCCSWRIIHKKSGIFKRRRVNFIEKTLKAVSIVKIFYLFQNAFLNKGWNKSTNYFCISFDKLSWKSSGCYPCQNGITVYLQSFESWWTD